MLRALSGLGEFGRLIDWRGFTPGKARPRASGSGAERVLAFGCADTRQAVFWLLRDTRLGPAQHIAAPVTLSFSGLEAGRYRVAVWDTEKNKLLDTRTADTEENGELRLALSLGSETALAITPSR